MEAPSCVRIWRDEIAPSEDPDDVAPRLSGAGGDEFSVLVVEDDADQAELIARALAISNLPAVTVAGSGREALGALMPENKATPRWIPSLVLLDLHLPDMPGIDVLRKIRKASWLTAIPVIVLTSHRSDAMVKSCLAAGANAFVAKSIRFDRFVQSIGRIAAFWSHDHCVPDVATTQKL